VHLFGSLVRRRQSDGVQGGLRDVHVEARARHGHLRGRSRCDSVTPVAQRGCIAVIAVAIALCSFSATANASGFGIARFGGEHGTVVATNPTALYYNPAGIGFTEGAQLFVDGQLALRSLSWRHAPGPGDVPEPAGFEGANYGEASAFNLFGGPMLGATMRVGDFAFGAAGYAPFGGEVHFDRAERFAGTMFPGAADGVARWHGYDASMMSIYATLGAAYRVGPLSIGATGNLILSSLSLDRAQVASGDGQNDLEREGRSRLEASGVHGSFGAGVMFEAIERMLWLGLSYQAQPGLGQMTLHGNLRIDSSVAMPGDSLARKADFHQALPDVYRLGLRFRPSDVVELRLAGDVTRWSVLRTQCVGVEDQPCTVLPDGDAAPGSGVIVNMRRFWRDSIGVRGGGSYWIAPTFELFAGVGYETAAAPDTTLDPVLADANNLALALGGKLQFADSWYIALSYTQLQFFSRNSTGKSTLADPAVQAITRRPDGGGEYSQWVGIVDANVLKTF
jgi:long-chain fatty acid transport protein